MISSPGWPVAWAAAALARQQQHDGRQQRPYTAEADQAHAAQPRAIRLSRELALDEVEIIADRREIGASLIGLSQRERRYGTVGYIGHGARLAVECATICRAQRLNTRFKRIGEGEQGQVEIRGVVH